MALLPVLLSPSFPLSPETSPTLGFPSPFVWTTSSLRSPCSPPAPWTFQRHRGPLGTRAGDAPPQAPSAPPCPLPVHPSTLPWFGPCLSSWAMLQSPHCFPVICHLLQCLHWVFQSDPDPPTSGKFVCAFGQQTAPERPLWSSAQGHEHVCGLEPRWAGVRAHCRGYSSPSCRPLLSPHVSVRVFWAVSERGSVRQSPSGGLRSVLLSLRTRLWSSFLSVYSWVCLCVF